jgi:hypothetical protein
MLETLGPSLFSSQEAAFPLDRLAEQGLLAAAVTESIETGAPAQEVLGRPAYEAGKTIGAAAGNLPAALEDPGTSHGSRRRTAPSCSATARSTGSPSNSRRWSAR